MKLFISIWFFILISILIFYYKTNLYYFSNTNLGKIIAIFIIFYMSNMNFIYGFISLILFLFYYKLFLYNDSNSSLKLDYLKGVDYIYWINLDRSIDRRQCMENMFQDPVFQEIPIQRIVAFDGKYNNPMKHFQLVNKINTNVEYSCLLSHLNSIREFSKSNNNIALIFEDDVTLEFKKYWKNTIQEIIDGAPPDWEIIQLCYIMNSKTNMSNLYTLNNYQVYHNYGNIASMAAYLINKNAAIKFMKKTYNEKNDKYFLENYNTHEADHYIYKCLKTYTYKYPYFIYPTENNSTLHEEDLESHIRSKLKIESMYKQMYN